ncbi:MAG: hypothetical protein U0872_15615 [Planctomycetaceae bacterium]
MQPTASASVDISIAVLSWINEELRQSLVVEQEVQLVRTLYWQQQAVTVLAAGLTGFCFLVLHAWA